MTKRITHELTYDAPAADVFAMLTTAAFREEVCARMDVIRASVTVDGSGESAKVRIEQVRPATGLPSYATTLVGDEIEIVQEESWTSPTHADVRVSIPGKPGEVNGTATLREVDGRTVESVDLEVKVRIPLVAGRAESLIADMMLKALKAENAAGRDYLSR